MNNWDSIKALSHIAMVSKYFSQITIDNSGEIITADPDISLISTDHDDKKKSIYFSDYFLESNWVKYETQRINAAKNNQASFTIDLEKIIYPKREAATTKWEFFFTSEEFNTCLGIGHPVISNMPYDISLGDFFDSSISGNKELLDSLLEDKFLGFWEFDLKNKTDYISQGLGQMLGYSQQELKNIKSISWQQHVHPEDFPSLVKDLKIHFHSTGNIPFKKEFRINPKTNETIWALGFGKTIQWSDSGHPIKILGCLVDISERKKQELWIQEHHYFLKELAFEQSHSLRARVANILGILEVLESEPQDNESKRLVQLMKKETILLDKALQKSINTSVSKNKSIDTESSQDSSFPNKSI